jgi:uncharacterized membrane protein YecN with MAPEG domain
MRGLSETPPPPHRALSVVLWGIGGAGAVLLWQAAVPLIPVDAGDTSTAIRLGHALTALLPASGVLFAMTVVQMLARAATGRVDPTRGDDPAFLVVNQRCISNTIEQFSVFAPALLALATGVGGRRMPEVMALGLVFGAARLAFWLGYLAAPLARAPGMVATVCCNAGALVAAAWIWLQ